MVSAITIPALVAITNNDLLGMWFTPGDPGHKGLGLIPDRKKKF
jgi:hypothetical protein